MFFLILISNNLYCNIFSNLAFVNFKITNTLNEDNFVNPGETFQFDIVFKNIGVKSLKNLNIKLTTNTKGVKFEKQESYVINLDSEKYMGTYYKNTTDPKFNNQYAYRMSVDKNYDINYPILIDWQVTYKDQDDFLNSNQGYFNIPVSYTNAQIEAEELKIIRTNNDDYRINPVENIKFDIGFKNKGPSILLNPKIKIFSETPGLQ